MRAELNISTSLKQAILSKIVDGETTKKYPQKSADGAAISPEAPVADGAAISSEAPVVVGYNFFEQKQAEKNGLDDIQATPEMKETLSKLNNSLIYEDSKELRDGKPSSVKTAQMLESGRELAKIVSPTMVKDFENLLNEVKNDIAKENNAKFGSQNGKEKNATNPIQMANMGQKNGQKSLNNLIDTISSEEGISVSDGGSNANLG